jgi:hypothetical protein
VHCCLQDPMRRRQRNRRQIIPSHCRLLIMSARLPPKRLERPCAKERVARLFLARGFGIDVHRRCRPLIAVFDFPVGIVRPRCMNRVFVTLAVVLMHDILVVKLCKRLSSTSGQQRATYLESWPSHTVRIHIIATLPGLERNPICGIIMDRRIRH